MQLEVQDRIAIQVVGCSTITEALACHRARILAETLATSFSIEAGKGWGWQEWDLRGETIAVSVSKEEAAEK